MDWQIRKAQASQATAISALVCEEARRNKNMIERSPGQIAELIGNFFVAGDRCQIIGACGFKTWSNKEPEVISFVVAEEHQHQGIGSALLKDCVWEIRRQGYKSAFTLTVTPWHFEKLGFIRKPIREFPVKVYSDCQYCPKNIGNPLDPKCSEIPMRLVF